MKHLRINYCTCGNPIFPTIPQIIFESGFGENLGSSTHKKRKWQEGGQNRTLNSLCFSCREKHKEQTHIICSKKIDARKKVK